MTRFQAQPYWLNVFDDGKAPVPSRIDVRRYRVIDTLTEQTITDRCGSLLQAEQIAKACNDVALLVRGERLEVEICEAERA